MTQKIDFESQILALFDSLPIIQNSKFNNSLWVCWFLAILYPPLENSTTHIAIIEVKEELNEFFAKEEKNKEKNLIDGMTPKQHRIWEVNQKKRLDLMEIETGTLKEVNGKVEKI